MIRLQPAQTNQNAGPMPITWHARARFPTTIQPSRGAPAGTAASAARRRIDNKPAGTHASPGRFVVSDDLQRVGLDFDSTVVKLVAGVAMLIK
jgi:hypothetical protein